MAAAPALQQVDALRSFNRFYTREIGVLNEGLLQTPFTLTQARVLFELGHAQDLTASAIAGALGLDLGYLSRILRAFSTQGLVARRKSDDDGRRILLSLTAKGRKTLQTLEKRSRDQVSSMLTRVPDAKRVRLLASLRDVQGMLSPPQSGSGGALVIRTRRIGDIGWAIERHAHLYTQEYGWNEEFEALVARLFATFADEHDPAKERLWVAELDGERVGCVFVVRNEKDPSVAQLRCLLVDPKARGMGVGRRLVAECIAFARSAGYRRMMLWTNDILVAARRIYETAGFTLVEEERHRSFGADLVGQVWTLDL